jgi:hypothetical protein
MRPGRCSNLLDRGDLLESAAIAAFGIRRSFALPILLSDERPGGLFSI